MKVVKQWIFSSVNVEPGFVFSQNSLVLGSVNMVMDCHKRRGIFSFFGSRAQELSKEFSVEFTCKTALWSYYVKHEGKVTQL
jgi:hypothetical protein